MKVRVRGIYTTALTKLLLDNGFEMVQSSLTIKKRFNLPDNSAPPDLEIEERYDMQGIRVLGAPNAVDKFQSILHLALEDALIRRWHASVDGIYNGKVTASDGDIVYVDIGGNVLGRLPRFELATSDGSTLLVQVERKRMGAKQPDLTINLKIVGDYAILVQDSKVGVSLKIRDLNRRAELYALGKTLTPQGWGIIWRESSANQSKETLENEITKLAEKTTTLNEREPHTEAPTLLIEGLRFMNVEFPRVSKRKLDTLRACATPTLDGHHFYKSCGGEVSAALEMAEKLLEKGEDQREVEESFKKHVLREFPEEGSQVDVEHVKPSGIVFHLGQATIEGISDEEIKYSRTIRSNGSYDGLDVKKEAGDKALSQTKRGEWHITTKYFSPSGEWKGTYINLNTPAEVYPKAIRYVDLEIDVCIQPCGTVKVLDMEKLEKALEKGFVSKKLFETVKEKANELAKANAV